MPVNQFMFKVFLLGLNGSRPTSHPFMHGVCFLFTARNWNICPKHTKYVLCSAGHNTLPGDVPHSAAQVWEVSKSMVSRSTAGNQSSQTLGGYRDPAGQ
jgi:hypothetical protein